MHHRSAFLLWVLIGAFAAGPALGSVYGDKPKKRFIPPLTTATGAELRGPLDAPAAAAPAPTPQIPTLPRPGASFVGLTTGGFASARPITPLRAIGDPAPICRAECAKVRVFCAVGDSPDCATRWVQCASNCSTGNLR